MEDIRSTEIITQRLQLSLLQMEDAAHVFEYARDPLVSENTSWSPHQQVDETKAFIEYVISKDSSTPNRIRHVWAIRERALPTVIGTLSFVQEDIHKGRVDYALSRRYWNKGYMTEALQGGLSWAFSSIPELKLITSGGLSRNKGSVRVLEKMRFEVTEIYKSERGGKFGGQVLETTLFQLERDLFEKLEIRRRNWPKTFLHFLKDLMAIFVTFKVDNPHSITMERRSFIKSSSVIISGAILPTQFACMPDAEEKTGRKNWAGNLEYSTQNLHEPSTIEDLQKVVRSCDKLRVLGTRHSFNRIADSKQNQVSVRHFDQVISLDRNAQTVTCGAGMRYGELCKYLNDQGFAIHNLASLPHISVAGACATATHGSGDGNGNLATAVSALEIITANGEIRSFSRDQDPEIFQGAVVGLGGLGLVTKISLDIQPAFEVRQDIFLEWPIDQLEQHFEDVFSSGYSVSLFTDWTKPSINQIWVKSRVGEDSSFALGKELFGARAADRDVHPIIELSAENCTKQMGIAGPWYDRLPHFRLDFTPSSGEELQSEFFVPREHAVEAIMTIQQMGEQISPHLFISEVRSIAADALWMSPCYQQDSVAIHFTWKPDWPAVRQLLPRIEAELSPYNVRPHWGKLFTMTPETLQSKYTKIEAFRKLLGEYDPEGKFRNDFLDRNVFLG